MAAKSDCLAVQATADDDCCRIEDSISSDVLRVDPEQDTDYDDIDKLSPADFPPQLQRLINFDRLREIYKDSNSISILVTGRTGSGKSTLINGILGLKINGKLLPAKEGSDIKQPCTTHVTEYNGRKGKIAVTVWDSPGLQDDTDNQDEYVQEMKMQCSQRDLTMYCVRITDGRYLRGKNNPDMLAIKKLTGTFGPEFWKSVIIVLTFANTLEAINLDWEELSRNEKVKAFQARVNEWKDQVREILIRDVGVPKQIVWAIRIVPAGHYRKPHLLSCEYWLSHLWFQCLTTIPTAKGRAALVKMNIDRFRNNIDTCSHDFKKSAEEQPIVVTHFAEATSDNSVGIDAGLAAVGEFFGKNFNAPVGLLTAPVMAIGQLLK